MRPRVGVEPAALLEDRHVHGLRAVLELLPVLVVRLVLPPEPPVVDLAPDRDLVEVDQRQMPEDALVEDQVGGARTSDQRHRAVPQRGGPERQRELERSAREVPVPEVVVVDHVRRDALEVRVAEMSELPLGRPAVAPPPRADPPVAPLLARRPRERVLRVEAVPDPRLEHASGLVAAANVDDDRGVTALSVEDAPADEPLACRLVRRPLDDRRERASADRQVDVRRQRDPVARRDPLVVQEARLVARRRARLRHG